MLNTKKKLLSVVVGGLITAPGPGPSAVFAQDDDLGGAILLETMVVTATRRQEIQSEVPISVTAFSGTKLGELGVENIYDLRNEVPNLTITTSFGGDSGATIDIRGLVQASSDSTLDAAVGVYQDDVFLARNFSVLGQLLDIERLEVLRGPQGTLFGRNTIGGALQVVSKKPEVGGDSDAYFKVGVGDFGLTEFSGAGTFQVSDTIAVRAAASVSSRDGYTTSYLVDDTYDLSEGRFGYVDGETPILEEIDTDNSDNKAFRISAVWQPSDVTRLDLSYYHNENDTNGILIRNRLGDLGGPNLEAGDIRTQGRGFSALTENDFYSGLTGLRPNGDDELDIAVATFEHQISDTLGMKLIASHAQVEVAETTNTDGLVQANFGGPLPIPSSLLLSSVRDQDADQSTFEFQLSGENESGNLQWIGGLYYFEEESVDKRAELIFSPLLEEIPPALLPVELQPLAGGLPDNLVDVVANNDSASVYGSLNWDVNDYLTMRFGGRYTEDSKGFLGRSTTVGGPIPDGVSLCAFTGIPTNLQTCELRSDADFENFTWDISADYQFSSGTFGYAKVGTGYRTGGISLNANSAQTAQPFNEDEVTSYELGLKTELGEKARLNASVFYVDYTDVQQNLLSTDQNSCQPGNVNGGTGVIITCNLGDGESVGFEVDTVWQISESFGLSANVGYTDFTFDDPKTRRTLTPEYTYAVSGIYTSKIASMPLRGILSYTFGDDFFVTGDANIPEELTKLEGSRLLSLSIEMQITENLDLTLWGRNLLEDEYFNFSTGTTNDFAIFTGGFPGEPRTFGVELNYEF